MPGEHGRAGWHIWDHSAMRRIVRRMPRQCHCCHECRHYQCCRHRPNIQNQEPSRWLSKSFRRKSRSWWDIADKFAEARKNAEDINPKSPQNRPSIISEPLLENTPRQPTFWEVDAAIHARDAQVRSFSESMSGVSRLPKSSQPTPETPDSANLSVKQPDGKIQQAKEKVQSVQDEIIADLEKLQSYRNLPQETKDIYLIMLREWKINESREFLQNNGINMTAKVGGPAMNRRIDIANRLHDAIQELKKLAQ